MSPVSSDLLTVVQRLCPQKDWKQIFSFLALASLVLSSSLPEAVGRAANINEIIQLLAFHFHPWNLIYSSIHCAFCYSRQAFVLMRASLLLLEVDLKVFSLII